MNQKDDQGNDEICVKIKTLDNNTFDIRIRCAQTVADLKYLIESFSTIPANRQRLLFKGRQLNNEDTLASQKIEDQCVVHLVANMPELESSPLNRGLSTSSIDEHENRNQCKLFQYGVDVQENRRNSRKKVLQQRVHGFQNLPPRPCLQQNVMTLQHLLQSFNTVAEVVEQGQIFAQRDFEVGQWIDFMETQGEWVEGYIGQKQQNQALIVHSKGEEWIQVPSNRLCLFRSHTLQKSFHMSPFLSGTDSQQLWSFSELLGQTAMLLTRAGNMMSRLADSFEEKQIQPSKKAEMSNLITGMIEEQRRRDEEKVEKQDDVTSLKSMKSMKSDKISIDYETSSIKSMKSDISKLTTYFSGHIHNQLLAENIAEEEEDSSQDMSVDNQRDAANISREFKENYAYYETSLIAAQLAPLSDRLGRLLIDLSPYLALSGSNINNVFQNHPNSNVSNLSIITNEGSQYSTQPKNYYFQVPILLTPYEIQQWQQNGAQINRIVSEQFEIINPTSTNNTNNYRQRRIQKKEEEEKLQFIYQSKIKQQNQQQQQQQQQQQYQQQQQQQLQQLQQQQQQLNNQLEQEETQQFQSQLPQQQKCLQKESDGKPKKKKKVKEVSFSEQISQLKKDKQC